MFKSMAVSWAWLVTLSFTVPTFADEAASKPREAPVSLHRILRYAMRAAPAMALGRAGVESGHAEVEAASPFFPKDPVVSASVGRRRTGSGSGLDYSIGLEQELDLTGQRGRQLSAARTELGARRAELLARTWFVHQSIHGAYHHALVARERAQTARSVLSFAERLVVVARQRLAAGETSQLPVRVAEAELALARQAALLADAEYQRIRLELAKISGWTQATLPTPIDTLALPERPPPAESLIQRARREQPELRAARARLSAAQARLQAAERRAWPNPSLGVVYQSEAEPGAEPTRILTGTLSLPVPIWVGSTPERARARSGVAQAEAEQAAILTSLALHVVQARERVDANARRALLYGTEILPSFETNLELLQKAFELGEIDILEVMVARERFLEAQKNALQAFEDYYDAWAELEATVGGELHGPGEGEVTAP